MSYFPSLRFLTRFHARVGFSSPWSPSSKFPIPNATAIRHQASRRAFHIERRFHKLSPSMTWTMLNSSVDDNPSSGTSTPPEVLDDKAKNMMINANGADVEVKNEGDTAETSEGQTNEESETASDNEKGNDAPNNSLQPPPVSKESDPKTSIDLLKIESIKQNMRRLGVIEDDDTFDKYRREIITSLFKGGYGSALVIENTIRLIYQIKFQSAISRIENRIINRTEMNSMRIRDDASLTQTIESAYRRGYFVTFDIPPQEAKLFFFPLGRLVTMELERVLDDLHIDRKMLMGLMAIREKRNDISFPLLEPLCFRDFVERSKAMRAMNSKSDEVGKKCE
ncbi:hypothetical protein BGX27_006132 [Mortierella sp. AM989]|nr:hypothetical protein BGX27_006132 [Mortierella sp. AM989]